MNLLPEWFLGLPDSSEVITPDAPHTSAEPAIRVLSPRPFVKWCFTCSTSVRLSSGPNATSPFQ